MIPCSEPLISGFRLPHFIEGLEVSPMGRGEVTKTVRLEDNDFDLTSGKEIVALSQAVGLL